MKIKTRQRWGRLVVIHPAHVVKNGIYRALCRCDCGTEKNIRHSLLMIGHTQSCGCLGRERAIEGSFKHGLGKTSVYYVWIGMRRRCEDLTSKDYPKYGGRGITVCERWQTFTNFFEDMGHRPEGRSIDRINNAGNYEPGNCRWATVKEQLANRRPYKRKAKELGTS